jgi:hypothetical protein
MAGLLRVSPRSLIVGCGVMLAFLLAAPAARADCDDQVLEHPFAPWADNAAYTLVPDGDLTGGAAGWQLDGADVVDENEPWYVHGGDTPAAVRLDGGESATTPPMCVTLLHPTMRFFVRNTGGILGTLTVEVVPDDGLALPVGVVLGLVQGDEWSPSLPQPVVANLIDGEVRFRFTAGGLGSSWVIDDVYVDPYKKG